MSSIECGKRVIQAEAEALIRLGAFIDARFDLATEMVLACRGSVVVTGVGKPWLVGQKISATLASTGTPSFALHPAEAVHGDLGRIRATDIVLALSNSGASEEVVRLLPLLKRDGVPIIGMTGSVDSEVGRHADVVLELGHIEEACPLALAPSASTTAMMAMGDALALAVMERRGFGREDYARYHPGGALGRKLMKVEEIMRPLRETAAVNNDATVKQALFAMTEKKTGASFVVDGHGILQGVFTDGDLRRHIEIGGAVLSARVADVMTRPGLRVGKNELATAALHVMETRRIGEIPVVDERGVLVGHIQLKDMVSSKIL